MFDTESIISMKPSDKSIWPKQTNKKGATNAACKVGLQTKELHYQYTLMTGECNEKNERKKLTKY